VYASDCFLSLSAHIQNELAHTLASKAVLEQDLVNSKLLAEKIEREGKQEAVKLQVF